MGSLCRDYGLSVTAAVLFLGVWLVYAVVEWFDFKNEMSWYGEPVAYIPSESSSILMLTRRRGAEMTGPRG